MNARQVKRHVDTKVLSYLQEYALHLTTAHLGGSAKQHDVTKVKEEINKRVEILKEKWYGAEENMES